MDSDGYLPQYKNPTTGEFLQSTEFFVQGAEKILYVFLLNETLSHNSLPDKKIIAMETTNLITAFKAKQLFLRKSIVVKFTPAKSFKKGLTHDRDIDTKTSVTIPTTTRITSPG